MRKVFAVILISVAAAIAVAALSSCDKELLTVTISEQETLTENRYKDRNDIEKVVFSEGVTDISASAFEGCSNLISVDLPKSIKTIGENAFKNCEKLENVYYGGDLSGWCSLKFSNALANPLSNGADLFVTTLNGYKLVTKGKLVIPEGIKNICFAAFYGCKGITGVEFSESVTSIGKSAFCDCEGITEAVLSDSVRELGDYVFCGCTGLTDYIVPDTVTKLGSYVFKNCSGLKTFEIKNGVTEIKQGLLNGCSSLEKLTIPFIGARPDVSPDDNNQYPFGYLFGTDSFTGAVETKQNYYGESLESTTETTYYVPSSLKTVIITGGAINCGAFENCKQLSSVTIPENVKIIGTNAFKNCENLSNVYYGGDLSDWCNLSFKNAYANPLSNGADLFVTTLNGYKLVTEGELVIPEGVEKVGFAAFYGCGKITNVIFPASVKKIARSAFFGCVGLKNVVIPDTVKEIGDYVFGGCSSLEKLTIPFVGSKIGVDPQSTNQYPLGYIFGKTKYTGGVATTQYYYGESLTEAASDTYYIPATLKSVTVTGGEILFGAFYGCSGINEIILPKTVATIGAYAFYNCSSLNSFVVPENVTEIKNHAFYGCSGINSINMCEKIARIGENAFKLCKKLSAVYYKGDLAKWNNVEKDSGNDELNAANVVFLTDTSV